jgi:CRISPR-associated endonuclease/helicase Cas3
MTHLKQALGLKEDESPFPWQEELLARFRAGIDNRMSLDIPTGLGKTSVMAAWLVAEPDGVRLPRRLVYVVDRRAVVDQATGEAERLRKWVETQPELKRQLGLAAEEHLPISTLRGQFADNRQWLDNPATAAIIVGTVDMVGSRLLFEGYGVSRKMRPYHAGFLGADTLFVLDEAHLVPPFERLLQRVAGERTELRGVPETEGIVPRFVLLSLSATGRHENGDVLTISHKDLQHPVASRRLRATKRLRLIEPDDDQGDLVARLANEAWMLSENGTSAHRIIVFCNSRAVAMKVSQEVANFAKGDKKRNTKREIARQMFVGGRRVRERQQLADWLDEHGFLAGATPPSDKPAFVFATSAGEVGVDLDADHMVGDLVAFERMVQRFGRVNRRGDGDAEIRVLLERDRPNEKEAAALRKALAKPERQRGAKEHGLVWQFDRAPKYRAALEALPPSEDGLSRDASPDAFRQLKISACDDDELAQTLTAASTPVPLHPELTRPILDSWSMTSLEKHSARPFVAPWLRGWVEDEPQTTIVWRKYLPTESKQCTEKQIKEFFESAPIHLTEKLETGSDDVFRWLLRRAERIVKLKSNPKNTGSDDLARLPQDDDVVAILIDHSGEIVRSLKLSKLLFDDGKEAQNDKNRFGRQLQNCTLIVDARMGGLTQGQDGGLLDDAAPETEPAEAADGVPLGRWIPSVAPEQSDADPIPSFRVLDQSADELREEMDEGPSDPRWKTCFRMPIQEAGEDEVSRFLTVQKFRQTVTSEESRSVTGKRSLEAHLNDTEKEAASLASQLKLPPELQLALKIAARNHDHGKNCDRWQNAFSAPEKGRPYAKTSGPLRPGLLHGYRHELASLLFVENDPDFAGLSEHMRELVLHLVAAHHGFARPVIRTDACEDAPPSALRNRARDVALRFARLQKQWGPWGLAWLESIFRAADQRASALIDDQDVTTTTVRKNADLEVSNG